MRRYLGREVRHLKLLRLLARIVGREPEDGQELFVCPNCGRPGQPAGILFRHARTATPGISKGFEMQRTLIGPGPVNEMSPWQARQGLD
jgi:hypothetical protein